MPEQFESELAELWAAISNKIIDRFKCANRIEELFREYGIKKECEGESAILDVAGGFGFPTLELQQRGYLIIYNDGSRSMFSYAMDQAHRQNISQRPFSLATLGVGTVPWQEFDRFPEEHWHALICRGNSLPYAVSWGKGNPDLSQAREEITKVLGNFHRILLPDGILYVDKQPEEQEIEIQDIGEVVVGERKLYITNDLNNDKANRIRNWTIRTRDLETGEEKAYPSKGYLILEDDLLGMLKDAGFKDIKKHILEGDVYEGFVAKKS